MMKCSLNIFLIFLFFPIFAFCETLIELEEKRFENERLLAQTKVQMIIAEDKIRAVENEIATRKEKIYRSIRLLKNLNSMRWGGLLATKDPLGLEQSAHNLKLLNQKNAIEIRDYKMTLEYLASQRSIYQNQVQNYEVLNQKIIDQEQKIKISELLEIKNIQENKANSLLLLKGNLTTPVRGEVIEGFGKIATRAINHQYNIFAKGLLFGTQPDAVVQAVGPGQIIFRDRIKHWGESVIIRHDGNYYSVYTSLKDVQLTLAQKIRAGEKIGSTNSNQFYFELRHGAVAINPDTWLKELNEK